MVDLPDGKKNLKMFIRFDRMYEREGQNRRTDKKTDRHRMTAKAAPDIALQNRNFRPVSLFISEMIQDRAIVTMEGE